MLKLDMLWIWRFHCLLGHGISAKLTAVLGETLSINTPGFGVKMTHQVGNKNIRNSSQLE